MNRAERSDIQGPFPYWGANGIVDRVNDFLFDEELVLVGEDGAPFHDPLQDVAFRVTDKVWVNNHIHVLRPSPDVDSRFLTYALNATDWPLYISGSTRDKLTQDDMMEVELWLPDLDIQRAIADHLDTETARIDALIEKKQRLLDRLDERIDAMVSSTIRDSGLVEPSRPALEIRRLLSKRRRPGTEGQIVTAFRDGQVTARTLRRAEGYTEAWTENATFQQVRRGDVVVHGLDGFAGAVGTCETDGICSPVYHVMEPLDGGDSDFYGRLLHVLATTGYLGLFAVSTRERAVDFRNWDLFGRIPIPVVSNERQREIGGRIRALRPLRFAVERSRELALEHRQALVTAAVTGELEIPGVA